MEAYRVVYSIDFPAEPDSTEVVTEVRSVIILAGSAEAATAQFLDLAANDSVEVEDVCAEPTIAVAP